jgi:hypothetical protein
VRSDNSVDVILKELNALKQREKEFNETGKRLEKAIYTRPVSSEPTVF